MFINHENYETWEETIVKLRAEGLTKSNNFVNTISEISLFI